MTTQTLPPPAAPPALAVTDSGTAPQPAPDAADCAASDWADADWPGGLPIILNLRPLPGGKTLAEIDVDRIYDFIAANELYAIEYNDSGELVIMPPTMMRGGFQEARLIAFVTMWALSHFGEASASRVTFHIPGLGGRGPDASWVSPERLAALDAEQYRTGQVCPDFVAEIRSPSNTLPYLQRKLDEYIAAGARLGWLIDPPRRRVIIYRPGREPETLDNPAILYGEDVMPGFEFRVAELIFDVA